MRMILFVTFPTRKFNALMREGQVGPRIGRILEDAKPEAAYFGISRGGQRTGVIVVDIASQADLPALTEPWYLAFEAEVETHPAMSAQEIAALDLDGLAKKYG